MTSRILTLTTRRKVATRLSHVSGVTGAFSELSKSSIGLSKVRILLLRLTQGRTVDRRRVFSLLRNCLSRSGS